MKYIKSLELNEAVNASGYIKAGKLGYNDQFLGRRSLSYTLSTDLGMNPKNEFGGGDWLGFDHVSLYSSGGRETGTILDDALSGKYTYEELKKAAADFLGIKESVDLNEAKKFKPGDKWSNHTPFSGLGNAIDWITDDGVNSKEGKDFMKQFHNDIKDEMKS